MKKNKIILLVIVILIVIGIIFVISRILNNNKQERKLSKLYENLNTSQTYLLEMEQNDNNKKIMARKDNKTIVDQYANGSHKTTLVKDNSTYLILHDRKEYYIYKQSNAEENFLTDGLKKVIDRDFVVGTEKVKGKKYFYEEYAGSTMFIITGNAEADEANIKTRFYFDSKDNLTYVKTIYGEEQELLKISLGKEVDDSIFEVPSDYAEN